MCVKRWPRPERSASLPRHFILAVEIAHSPALPVADGDAAFDRAILGGLGWLGLRECHDGGGGPDQRKYDNDGCNSKHENPPFNIALKSMGPSAMTALWRSQGELNPCFSLERAAS
jgi:hypothetical protein